MITMSLIDFIRESNRIEGILTAPSVDEFAAYVTFLDLNYPTTKDLEAFVKVIAPGNVLRDEIGLNVYVGNHIAPAGGPNIRTELDRILLHLQKHHPWRVHLEYETLHPFTDGNGRSGRVLWLWQMKKAPLGFLHTFYYQTLEHSR